MTACWCSFNKASQALGSVSRTIDLGADGTTVLVELDAAGTPSLADFNTTEGLGLAAAQTRLAQSFTSDSAQTITAARFRIAKTGSPTDDVVCALQADSGGVPSGTDLASATVVNANIPGTAAWLTWDLPDTALSAGTTYWLVLRRTGAVDAVNGYTIASHSAAPYPFGSFASWNGTSWTADASRDLAFEAVTVGGTNAIAGTVSALVEESADQGAWRLIGALECSAAELSGPLVFPNVARYLKVTTSVTAAASPAGVSGI
jgi:hypothetical protein